MGKELYWKIDNLTVFNHHQTFHGFSALTSSLFLCFSFLISSANVSHSIFFCVSSISWRKKPQKFETSEGIELTVIHSEFSKYPYSYWYNCFIVVNLINIPSFWWSEITSNFKYVQNLANNFSKGPS